MSISDVLAKLGDEPSGKTMPREAAEFAAQLIQASVDGLAYTTNTLIDNLTNQYETERATNDAIRDGVASLLEGPWMPTPNRLLKALWPSEETVNRYRKGDAS